VRRPPTMVIRAADDDERTLVDPRRSAPGLLPDETAFFVDPVRLCHPEPPFEGSGQAKLSAARRPRFDESSNEVRSRWQGVCAWLLRWRRTTIEIGVTLALTLGLCGVAYQQWWVVNMLRETVDEIGAGRSTSYAQELVRSPNGDLALIDSERRVALTTREIAPHEREALERRGADLITSNDFSGALTHYQMLTELFPQEVAFRDLVRVLRAKLRCDVSAKRASGACS
jgi:hypothetical protein